MRLLVINANTTRAVTDRLVETARAAMPDVDVVGLSGRFGARYIASRAAYAIAGHAVLDAYAADQGQPPADAAIVACFGDPGVAALREVAACPVIGMAEAACHEAARIGRFAIVTGGAAWRPMLEEYVEAIGLGSRLASVRAVAPTAGEMVRDLEAAEEMLAAACRATVEQDGAETVILGGAGLVGLAGKLAGRVPVPVIDALEPALRAAVEAASRSAAAGSEARPCESVGLSDALAGLLSARLQPTGQ